MSVLERKELEASTLADLHALASELGIESYRRLRREALISALVETSGGETEEEAAEQEPDEELSEEPAEEPGDDIEAERERRLGHLLRRRSRSSQEKKPEPEEEPVAEEEPQTEEEPQAGPADAEPAPEEEAAPTRERARDKERARDEEGTGILDILPNGSGFLRADPFVHAREDVYVSPAQIRRCELRAGDELSGPVRPPRRSERYPSLVRVETVNGGPAEPPADRARFEELTAVWATERLPSPGTVQSVPYGKGSRVAVGGPAGAGATTLLREIASTLASEPALETLVVLVGVRPEEVTDWKRDLSVPVSGGSFDRSPEEQAQVAEMAAERAKRVAERGGDAVLVVDALDALTPGAARRVFAAARNTEEAGSLTVIAATGTAGELQRLATTRIVLEPGPGGGAPSISATASGTSRADLLG